MRRARKLGRRAGYTLVELMMVVMVIAVSAVVFAPGISRAMTERRVSSVARELIRIGRRARSDTFGYLRAHLIWITPATGRVMLLRGPNNSCLLPAWNTIATDCSASATAQLGTRCLENLFVSTISAGGAVAMQEETLNASGVAAYGTAARALCYAPNGVVYHGTGSGANALSDARAALSDLNTVNGGFVYALHSGSGDPVASDRVHRVLFPLGSSARSIR